VHGSKWSHRLDVWCPTPTHSTSRFWAGWRNAEALLDLEIQRVFRRPRASHPAPSQCVRWRRSERAFERRKDETRWHHQDGQCTPTTCHERIGIFVSLSICAGRTNLKKRQERQSEAVRAIAWKAQHRLNKRYVGLATRGKPQPTVLGAREVPT
jgi:hypothetical protein